MVSSNPSPADTSVLTVPMPSPLVFAPVFQVVTLYLTGPRSAGRSATFGSVFVDRIENVGRNTDEARPVVTVTALSGARRRTYRSFFSSASLAPRATLCCAPIAISARNSPPTQLVGRNRAIETSSQNCAADAIPTARPPAAAPLSSDGLKL